MQCTGQMLAVLGSFTSRSLTKNKQGPESFICNPWPVLLANDGKSRAQSILSSEFYCLFSENVPVPYAIAHAVGC